MDAQLSGGDGGEARIGPNAIIRIAEALEELSPAHRTPVFAAAGLVRYLEHLPESMVPEADVSALQTAVGEHLPPVLADSVNQRAGQLTADYLLANRIPRAVQGVLKPLPAGLAARVLLRAITQHAWTFAGSGSFRAVPVRRGAQVTITGCPVCAGRHLDHPACGYFTATFAGLFVSLVHSHTRVRETACQAMGDPACLFELRW